MIVEFIGSTGAGKSTLIREVQRKLAQTVEVTTAFDLAATPLGLQRVTQPTLQNLLQEAAGFPFLLGSLHRHKAFIFFSLRMLARQADFSIFTINILRSLVRKLGVYEISGRRAGDRIVLVDEGTLLAAHNLFVYSSARYTPEEINQFATLVPLPDAVVYVKAPIQTMVERSLRRTDPPRELQSRDREMVTSSICRAVAIFDQLVERENIRSRLLNVENPDCVGRDRQVVVKAIAESLLERNPSAKPNQSNGVVPIAGVSPERARHAN